ncbi:surface lipoprotein assembly modifier [Rhizobium tubonense]|uniref:surface lipoprotein assembly modifier n=1 Tax=Rhizobium tubonense TaxID=484088 RepID=UPI0011B609D6|nr:surface lipoprotein assembly modifier [Rhizobium tubonense]
MPKSGNLTPSALSVLAKCLGSLFAFYCIIFSGICIANADTGKGYSFESVRSRIEAGQYDEARALVAQSGTGSASDVARAFTEALILKHQGNLKAAAEQMQKIVLAHPKFDRVRQELAHTYFLLGENEHAKYQFQILSASSQSPAFRSLYNNYIDSIDARRPWTLDGYVSIAPSSNITNGVNSDTVFVGGVPLVPGNKQKSGVGINFGASGTYRFDLTDRMALAVGGNFDGTKYRDKDYDDFSGRVFSELSYKNVDWRFGIGPTLERTYYGWEGSRFGYGAEGSVQRRIGAGGDILRLTSGVRYLDYDSQDAMSGVETTVGLRYQHAFSASLLANIGVTTTRMDAEKDFNSYKSARPYLEVYSDLPFGILGSIAVGYESRNYGGKFPWTGQGRKDGQIGIAVSGTFRNLSYMGIAPQLEYRYTNNNSNIGLYDYDSHAVNLYFTKKY